MKISDYISKTIQEYPLLYKDVNYEKSKLKVLNHIFFTNGNGLNMALPVTDNISDGGYIVSDKYDENNNRIADNVYGIDKYKSLPDNYFESNIYTISCINNPIEIIEKEDDEYLFRFESPKTEFHLPYLTLVENIEEFSPYPVSEKFSLIGNIYKDDLFLQDDWKKELIILVKRTLEYYTNDEQYCNHNNYPTEHNIKSDLNRFISEFKDNGISGVNRLQKIWSNTYNITNEVPSYDDIKELKTKTWEKFRKNQIIFLTNVLTKYEG